MMCLVRQLLCPIYFLQLKPNCVNQHHVNVQGRYPQCQGQYRVSSLAFNKRVVIIWFILLNVWFILITLHDIFFNTLMAKGMSRSNIVTFCFGFFHHQEGNLFFTLHPALMWSKYSTAVFSSSLTHFQTIVDDENKLLALLHDLTVQLSTLIFLEYLPPGSVDFTVPVIQQNSNLWHCVSSWTPK